MLTARLHSLEYIRLEKQNVAIPVVAFPWNDRAFCRPLSFERRSLLFASVPSFLTDVR